MIDTRLYSYLGGGGMLGFPPRLKKEMIYTTKRFSSKNISLDRGKIFKLKNGGCMKYGGKGLFGGAEFYEIWSKDNWNLGTLSAEIVDSETVKVTLLMPEDDHLETLKDAVKKFIDTHIKPGGYKKIMVVGGNDWLKYFEGMEVLQKGTIFKSPVIEVK